MITKLRTFIVILIVIFSYLLVYYVQNSKKIGTMQEDNNLIPKKIFFDNLELNKQSPRLSPSGDKISYIAPHNGVLNIWVGNSNNLGQNKVITNDTKRGIRQHFWAYTNEDIFYLKDEDGDENARVYVLNLLSGKETLLTPAKSILATVVKISPNSPNEILVGLNDRNPAYHDLYKINITTGDKELVYKNDQYSGFICDDEFNIVFASKVLSNGGIEYFYNSNGTFISYIKIDYENAMTTSIVAINRANTHFYMTDSRVGNVSLLRKIKLEDIITLGSKALGDIIFSNNEEITDLLFSQKSKDVIAVETTYFKSKWHILEPKLNLYFKKINEIITGEFSVASSSQDDKYWIIAESSDTKPLSYYLYNLDKNQLEYLFCTSQELAAYSKYFVPMNYFDILSRDGLKIPSYYSLPIDVTLNSENKPSKSVPFILLVHGGPQVRDGWGFNKLVQFFTNRGYGVLQMNYRGSSGFGKDLMNKGVGEWGAKAHDDLIDGVNWLIDNKFADKDKIAIVGGSYGGYAALAGVTFTPNVFACAVDIVGPSNLVTLINSIPEYWKPYLASIIHRIGGDPKTPEGLSFLKSRSPLFFVDKITKPLLILHGENDPRVKLAESNQIVDLMVEKNIPVTYAVFPNEGHGFARPENNLACYSVIEGFLSKFLGGKKEAITDELKNSSIIIKQDATK